MRKKKLNLRKTLFLLPNMLTLCSIFCAFRSVTLSAAAPAGTGGSDYAQAALFLVYAICFDMLDGRVARMTKTQSSFGLQLDSLADAISFGVAPALLLYQWSLHQLSEGLLVAFAFTAAGVVRLARFNVLSMDESGTPQKPGKYIVGLPVPGAAGVLLSLVVANHSVDGPFADYPWALAGLVLFLAFLMVSTIKFRSFKDLKLNAATLCLVLFAIGSSTVISMQTKPAFVLVWLLSLYVVIGLVETTLNLVRRGERRRPREESSH